MPNTMVFVMDSDNRQGAIIPENEKLIGHTQLKIQVWRGDGSDDFVDAKKLRLMTWRDTK